MVQALKKKFKNEKGFTLIELLAVIVILGIIAAIAIPAIGNVISKSDNKAKVQEALQIINAAKLYTADKNPKATVVLTLDGAGTKDGSSGTNAASLSTYLDHVNDKSFQVTATYDSGTENYTYTISGHGAVAVVKAADSTITGTSVSEQNLVDYGK